MSSASSISYETDCNLSRCLNASNCGRRDVILLKNSSIGSSESIVAKNCCSVIDQTPSVSKSFDGDADFAPS